MGVTTLLLSCVTLNKRPSLSGLQFIEGTLPLGMQRKDSQGRGISTPSWSSLCDSPSFLALNQKEERANGVSLWLDLHVSTLSCFNSGPRLPKGSRA